MPPSTSLAAGVWLVSAPYCAPCSRARALLASLPPTVPVREVSVVDAPDLVRALDVRSSPTLLVVAGDGTVVRRLVGVPDRHQLVAVLDDLQLPDRRT